MNAHKIPVRAPNAKVRGARWTGKLDRDSSRIGSSSLDIEVIGRLYYIFR